MDRTEVIDAIVIFYIVLRIVAVITIGAFLLLKALVFRRAGKFGEALAKSNVAIALAFAGTILLLIGLDFFRTSVWILGITLGVLVYVVKAAIQMKNLYGSWGNVRHEAKLTLVDLGNSWGAEPLVVKIVTIILAIEFIAAVVLVEVKGIPQELVLPTSLVHPTPTPIPSSRGTAVPVISPNDDDNTIVVDWKIM